MRRQTAGRGQRGDDVFKFQEVILAQGSGVADPRLFDAAEHAESQVVVDASIRKRLLAVLARRRAYLPTVDFKGWEEAGECRRRGDRHRHGRQAHSHRLEAVAIAFLATLQVQAVAAERTKATFAQVGR